MKKILFLTLVAILSCSWAFAQDGLENVVVEKFYIADANDATAPEPVVEGATTYRVYIDMAPGWEFQALYAEDNPAENKLDTLRIESTEPFFNNEDRGETFGYNIGTNRLDEGTVMIDSYLSTGRTSDDTEGVLKDEDDDGAIQNEDGYLQNDDPEAGTPISQLDGNIASVSMITFSPTPGLENELEAIFGEDDQAGNSFVATDAALGLTVSLTGPNDENRVLIGQFTTHGDFSFELNVQIRNIATGEVQQWVARTPQAGQFSIPELIFPVPNQAPTAAFTADPTTGTAPLMVDVDASASTDDGMIESYDWDFGNGETGTGVNASTTYTDAGTYTITLTVTDDAGATATATETITVDAANVVPTASFTADPTSGTAPLMVNVDASASSDPDGMITSYEWDFGNGEMGTGVMASTTYNDAGSYTITLTVTDNDGATATTTQMITVMDVQNMAPTASFTATPESGNAPLMVEVDASASSDPDGTISSYDWDFGNGETGTGETASTTYNDAGTYTITLTVTDNDGATSTATTEITVNNPPANQAPMASFSSAPNSGTAPLVVNFNASTSSDPDGNIADYFWDFGDGTTDNTNNVTPTHTYNAVGTYTVTLTVTDNDGATDDATVTISVVEPDQEGLEDIIVETFYVADANDASAPDAVVEGAVTYRVYVDMADNWEFQALYAENNPAQNKVDVLKIESTEPFFNNEDRGATFGYDIGTNRLDEGTVMLDSYLSTGRTSDETSGVLKEDDNDGAIANADGYLQNNDPLAGIPISEQDGNIPTTSMVTFTPTPGFEAELAAVFGEVDQAGNALVTDNGALGLVESLQGPTADNRVLIGQFTTHGQFCFELNIQLRNTVTGEVQQWVAQTPAAGQFTSDALTFCSNLGPIAEFTADPTSGTAPLDVSVDASASSDPDGMIVSYDWDFGNGETGTGVNASTNYPNPGTYTITLTVTDDAGATATATETIVVEAAPNEDPIASFTADPTTGTAPLLVNFDASASSDPDGTIVSYAWDFGDSNTGSGVTTSHTYTTPGTYTATLTVTDDAGATASATATIVVEQGTGGTARIQFINGAAFETIRVDVNGEDYGVRAYWTASPYVDVPAGVPVTIDLVPINPFSTQSPVSINTTFAADETYSATIYGTWNESDNFPIDIAFFAGAQETVSDDEVGLLVAHASPDQVEVDVVLTATGAVLFDDVEYGTYNDIYTIVPAQPYVIDLTPSNDNDNPLHRYNLDISWWKGRTAVVFATGQEGTGTFQTWVALSNGGTFPLGDLPLLSSPEENPGMIAPGINNGSATNLVVFPNPVSDKLSTAVYVEKEQSMILELYDSRGSMVTPIYDGVQYKGTNTYDISVEHLTPGMYFVRLSTDDSNKVVPVVIVK